MKRRNGTLLRLTIVNEATYQTTTRLYGLNLSRSYPRVINGTRTLLMRHAVSIIIYSDLNWGPTDADMFITECGQGGETH
jgi:hypothetical protein